MNKSFDHYSHGYGLRFPRSIIPSLTKSILSDFSNLDVLRVFEIGFGIGNNARMLKEYGIKNYYGIEISKSAIKRVNELTSYPPGFIFQEQDILEFVYNPKLFPKNKFNIVLESASLQHCTNNPIEMRKILELINHLLLDNGLFITQWSGSGNLEVNKRFSEFIAYESVKEILGDLFILHKEFKIQTTEIFPNQDTTIVEYGAVWKKPK